MMTIFFFMFMKSYRSIHIWLELTRTGILIRRMSPKHLHSRASQPLSVDRNCMVFLRLVRNCHGEDDIKIYQLEGVPKKSKFSGKKWL